MHQYEIVVVMRADLTAEDVTTHVDTITGWVTAREGQVVQVDHWGRRKLAYPIRKQRDGYYVLLKAELPPAAPVEIERNLRITEDILRFLVTREDA